MTQELAWCLGSEFIILWSYLGDEKFDELCKILSGRELKFVSINELENLKRKIRIVKKFFDKEITEAEAIKQCGKIDFDMISELLKYKHHQHCFIKIEGEFVCKICGKKGLVEGLVE